MDHSQNPRSNVLQWLDNNPNTADILSKARWLINIESYLRELMPRSMAADVHLAQIDGQEMTLIVPSPAYAARLRQISNTLMQQLETQGLLVNKLSIRIDANMASGMTKKPYTKTNTITKEGLSEFARLKENIAPSPLLDAIERLLKHHGVN